MSNRDPLGYYAILGISPDADASTIKKAYRRRAMELHPDRNPGPEATRQFQHLIQAYQTLSDDEKRRQYDTQEPGRQKEHTQQTQSKQSPPPPPQPSPIVCSCCQKVTAQPRYVVFYEVKSFVVFTRRTPITGIFCSTCAEKKSLRATAVTWLLGWWGVPWGPIYSLHALFKNMFGGERPLALNARLAAQQAWTFASLGQRELARAVALDAMKLASKLKVDPSAARDRRKMGYEVKDEGQEIRADLNELLDRLHTKGAPRKELSDVWARFGSSFYQQLLIMIIVVGSLSAWIGSEMKRSSQRSAYRPYVSAPSSSSGATYAGKSAYPTYQPPQYSASNRPSASQSKEEPFIPPLLAPNGLSWPAESGYLEGYKILDTKGYSTLTIDNSRNDSPIHGKIYSLNKAVPEVVRQFYITPHGKYTLDSFTPGKYELRYMDLRTGATTKSEPILLTERRTYEGIEYSTVRMTLYKVRNGNMQTYSIPRSQF